MSLTPLLPSTLVVYAKAPERVAPFYLQALQLACIEEGPGFSVLGGPGVEISIVRIPEAIATDIQISDPPALREDTPVKASFAVDSLARVRDAVAASGGGLHSDDKAWRWRGAVHLDGWDPEGNVVQFRQVDA